MMYWRFTIKSLLLLLASLGHFCEGYTESQNQCIKTMSNGCSAPGIGRQRLHNTYSSTEFKPACDKHDICYHCGKTLSWSRLDCDLAFHKNMRSICDEKYTQRQSKRSFWSRIRNKFRQSKHLVKSSYRYLKTDEETVGRCYQAADLFYNAVRVFGSRYYKAKKQKNPNEVCHFGCAAGLGKPPANIKSYLKEMNG